MPFSSGYFSVIILLMISFHPFALFFHWQVLLFGKRMCWMNSLIWTDSPNFPLLSFAFFQGYFPSNMIFLNMISTWVFSPLIYKSVIYFKKEFPKPLCYLSLCCCYFASEDVRDTLWLGFFSLHCLCFLCIVSFHNVFYIKCLLIVWWFLVVCL